MPELGQTDRHTDTQTDRQRAGRQTQYIHSHVWWTWECACGVALSPSRSLSVSLSSAAEDDGEGGEREIVRKREVQVRGHASQEGGESERLCVREGPKDAEKERARAPEKREIRLN